MFERKEKVEGEREGVQYTRADKVGSRGAGRGHWQMHTMLLDDRAQRVARTDVFVHRLAFHRHFPCLKIRLNRVIQERILGFVADPRTTSRRPHGLGRDRRGNLRGTCLHAFFRRLHGGARKNQKRVLKKGSLFPTPIRRCSLTRLVWVLELEKSHYLNTFFQYASPLKERALEKMLNW